MSTETGHSLEHALQLRHRSSASCTSLDRQPLPLRFPSSISNNRRERPRVLCRSSLVARYDGHIPPPLSLRHAPTPTHRRIALPQSPSSSGYPNIRSTV